jgi:competence protein ComEC
MNFVDTKLYFINNSENRSSFFKLVYGNTSILFAGELENEMEYKYCKEYGSFLKSDVLVVANNGRMNSTSVDFLKTVDPNISLISASNQNKFYTISSLIVDRLTKFNINIFRTDKDKAILLQSDGKKFQKINWN